ncbi:hypothetical protein MA16_Dca024977 [Dendrobium catenatum]|uniref:Uncharacterized protein n=1 Tax=Dendrobium catenatum TaxID=906689 RepID=A0A2I0VIX4_9ASPA|nr:hypothetical protein MA16_Dca024977 [Dendrobium catenatum]
MGVVATDVNAWTPNQELDHKNVRGDSKKIDTANDSFKYSSQNFDCISECIQLKRLSSTVKLTP